MKNNNINDINEFKQRIKKLYEYKMVDLNPSTDISVRVNEDENEQKPAPAPQTKPVEPQPQAQAPAPEAVQEPKEDNTELISFLKNEMQKLENIVNSINNISSKVEDLGNRMNNINSSFGELSKAVDEIREPSDIEKLEMRSFDSYPYNKTLTDVWKDKEKSKEEQELQRQGIRKTDDGYEMDYVPMSGMNYNRTDIKNQF
jgi:DNA repair ATPase RecN